MTSVARRDVENLPGQGRSCQSGTTGLPRHDWSMRLLGVSDTRVRYVGVAPMALGSRRKDFGSVALPCVRIKKASGKCVHGGVGGSVDIWG